VSGLNLSSFSQAHLTGQSNPVGVKLGSLQKFVKSMGAVENFGPDKFHKQEVHKIAILDLRIMNLDRNEQNILVNKVTKTYVKNGKTIKGKIY
jgi:Phosphatidylinositol 3- and 4-kinase